MEDLDDHLTELEGLYLALKREIDVRMEEEARSGHFFSTTGDLILLAAQLAVDHARLTQVIGGARRA